MTATTADAVDISRWTTLVFEEPFASLVSRQPTWPGVDHDAQRVQSYHTLRCTQASYDRLVQVVGGLMHAAHLLRHPFGIADTGRITVHQ